MNVNNRCYFFIDAESDGLYGRILSAAVVVTDRNGTEIEHAYYGIRKTNLNASDAWVQRNVLPVMGEYEECSSEEELLERIWSLWMKYREHAFAIGDVIYPVECGLFRKCVAANPKERVMNAPFPLMDISSMLYAKGVEPLKAREELLDGMNSGVWLQKYRHNALYDVRGTIEVWKRYIREKENDG